MANNTGLKGNSALRALSVVVCVATGACSSSSRSSAATSPKSESTTMTTLGTSTSSGSIPNSESSLAQDQTMAAAIVLRATDLPGVWNAGPVAANDQTGDVQVTRCLGIPNSDADETAYAGSPQFTQGSVQIDSRTTVYNATAIVASDLRGSASPNFVRCEMQLLATASNGGAINLHIAKTSLPATAGALHGFRFTGSFDVVQSGKRQRFRFDEVALAHDRVEVSFEIIVMNALLPPGLIDRATAAMTRRLQ